MKVNYFTGNLMDYTDSHYVAHCISADLALGAGIALQFRNKYPDMPVYLLKKYKNSLDNVMHGSRKGCCLQCNNVFNLVTKCRYFNKPTYESLREALNDMKDQLKQKNIKELYIPKIGCGLDRLNWNEVENMLISIFKDMDIVITVVTL